MKIAIIEDTKQDQQILFEQIKQYAAENHIAIQISLFDSGEDFLKSPDFSRYDILFLDIYMQGLTGMETAKAVRQVSQESLIVFITATDLFAVESYEVNALYYLLKPFTNEHFVTVMERIQKHIKKEQLHIIVKSKGENLKIPLVKIKYVDYYAHYVQIHTDSMMIRTYMKFFEIEQILLKHPEFLWCFRNIIINMNVVKKVEDSFFLLENEERVPINRKMIKEIKENYRSYMFMQLEQENGFK